MRNKLTNELAVCGYNAVRALADFHPERINRLFLREDLLRSFGPVCKGLAQRKRPYKVCDDEELERLCKSPRHQGAVAMIFEPEISELTEDDFYSWNGAGETMLFLASVGNDNNLGAIVRSAAFFGVKRIIVSGDDGEARLTTSGYRVAEGGMEHVEFRSVADDAAFLRAAAGAAVAVGADHRASARLKELPALIARERGRLDAAARGGPSGIGVVVALGNEERGLTAEAKAACALLVRIPGTGEVESLNVAQAATLFLHQLYELN
jgi:TrmH RNA methyltransferase